jgi:hypothetical protein
MTASEWLFIFSVAPISIWLIIFIVMELYMAISKKPNSLTFSQRLVKLAKEGNPWAKAYILVFPLFLMLAGFWLFWHWGFFCIQFGVLCRVDV